MAEYSVAYFSSFINRQIQSQEQIESYLWKLEALMTVATMTDDFYDIPEDILRNYFSIASNLIEKAGKVNQISIDQLLKSIK
jgi:hypothetical protein